MESPPFALQASTYGAEITRRSIGTLLQRGASIGSITGGLVGATDLTITPPGSGMTINVAPGEIWVPGSSASTQSGYYCRVSSSTSLAIATSSPSLPRIDRVSAVVTDAAYSGATNTFAVAVETGTPTASATLSNLLGVAAAPASSYTIGYVLVPANATSIVGADILNVAQQATLGLPSSLDPTAAGSSVTAANGQNLIAAPSITVTLPSPSIGSGVIVAVTANASVTGSTPVTVSGSNIQGLGLASASSFKIGTPGASVTLESDATNWWIVQGQQDTGWVTMTMSNATATGSPWFPPQIRVIGDRAWLRGAFTATASGASTLTLPAIATPVSQAAIAVLDSTGNVVEGSTVRTTGSISSLLGGVGHVGILDGLSYSTV